MLYNRKGLLYQLWMLLLVFFSYPSPAQFAVGRWVCISNVRREYSDKVLSGFSINVKLIVKLEDDVLVGNNWKKAQDFIKKFKLILMKVLLANSGLNWRWINGS